MALLLEGSVGPTFGRDYPGPSADSGCQLCGLERPLSSLCFAANKHFCWGRIWEFRAPSARMIRATCTHRTAICKPASCRLQIFANPFLLALLQLRESNEFGTARAL